MAKKTDKRHLRRKIRIRKKVFGTAESPRLTVFKSAKHMYAQAIDDANGVTLAAASTAGKEPVKDSGNVKGAKLVGSMIAEKLVAKKITSVVFDRNGFRYHGRIKALADAAREKGLKF